MPPRCRYRLLAWALIAGALARPAQGQARLELDDLADPERHARLAGRPPANLTWVSDNEYVWPRTEPASGAATWLRVQADTGRAEPLFAADGLEAALKREPGMAPELAARLARQDSLLVEPKGSAAVLVAGGRLYEYGFAARRLQRLATI